MASDKDITAARWNPATVFPLVATAILAIATVAFALMYMLASRDLDGQRASVAALQTELLSVKSVLEKETSRVAELQSEIQSKEQALAQEKSTAESAQAALDREKARLPPVPVRIVMRRSVWGGGLVITLVNNSEKQLPLLLGTVNPTTQAVKKFSLQIAPGAKAEIGSQEGWPFASGDQVLLRSAGFEDVPYTVP